VLMSVDDERHALCRPRLYRFAPRRQRRARGGFSSRHLRVQLPRKRGAVADDQDHRDHRRGVELPLVEGTSVDSPTSKAQTLRGIASFTHDKYGTRISVSDD